MSDKNEKWVTIMRNEWQLWEMSDNYEKWVGFLFDYDYALQYVFICCDYPRLYVITLWIQLITIIWKYIIKFNTKNVSL